MARLLVWFLAVFSVAGVIGGSYPPRPRPPPIPRRSPPSKDTYFISAPSQVIPGTKYGVTVDILNGTDVNVQASLQEGFHNSSTRVWQKRILESTSGVFSKGTTGRMEIELDERFKCGSCELLVQGTGGQVFERTQSVTVKEEILSIFIQTDKAIYKPGQRVRYRAFAVYQDLSLFKGEMSLEIREPSGNRMKVESGLRDQSAVVEGFFDLSDQPPFGDWSIKIQTENLPQSEIQKFTVAQYELPRFEVTVNLPPFALTHETEIRGTVIAKYTYGKPVKGMVDLLVGPDRGPDSCGKMPKTVNVGFEIDGEGTFTVTKANIQRVLYNIHGGTRVRFTAKVTESATGVTLEGSKAIEYYSQLHTMAYLSSTPSVFKPGLQYTATIQVKKPDGTPPDSETRAVTMWAYAQSLTTVPDQDKYGVDSFSGTFPLPPIHAELGADGLASFNIDIPSNATNIWMKVHYGTMTTSKDARKAFSASSNYLQLTLLGSDIKSGQTADFQVQGTEEIEMVNYEIISRNAIAKVGTVGAQGQSSFRFAVEMTQDMGPVASLVVYYVRDSGEVVADSISFNVDDIFKHKVSLDFSAERAAPNNNIQLKVNADPMSKVFLLAVDESVLLLKSGNDVSTSKVQSKVGGKEQMDSEYAMSSATSVEEVFSKSGLVIITDATLRDNSRWPNVNMRRGYPGPSMVYDMDGMEDVQFSISRANVPMPMPPLGSNPGVQEVKRVRNKFPEAWLWTDVATNSDGSYVINTTVPDTITTWVASAFATNQRSGLGVSATKANVTVFKSFFVSLKYPQSIKRNEQAVVQATVFNYLQEPAYVTVSLKDTTGFQHVEISGETERVVDQAQSQSLWVRADSHGVVYFPIVGKEVGVYDIEVKAQSTMAADGVRRQINIEAEGFPNTYNHAVYIEQSSTSGGYSERHSIVFPESAVPGSKKINVGLSGDLIGPSFDNIDNLLTMPTGCGEQNMLKLAPALYMAQYLKATGQMTSQMMEDIVARLSSGYQSQLTYRRSDSSFSAFGDKDESGSTWLTAYVARVLSEAREFTYVDPNILLNAVDWLVHRQRDDGAFVELGNVIDPATQGKSTGPALTAYVLLTLHQNRDLISQRKCERSNKNCERTWKWNNATINATQYLENSVNSIRDGFSMSVVTYALTQVRSSYFFRAFRKLKGMSENAGGLMCWKGNSTAPNTTPALQYRSIWRPPTPQARPIDTLITSYALMAYASRSQIRQALPVVKCLTQHKNFMGGFASTQDTSVGLQALSAFASKAYNPNNNLHVTFDLNGDETISLRVDSSNMLNYQTRGFAEVDADTDRHDVEVKAYTGGSGTAVAEINYGFNMLEMPDSDAFDVSTVLLDDSLDNFNLMVCTKWLKSEKTGMVVQEIEIPSGFEPDLDTIGNVVGMKRFERRGNKAVVYFDEIVKTSTCYSILMSRISKVAKSEKTFVHTFNYYNPGDSSTVFYHPRQLRTSTICKVCPGCCNPQS